MFYLLLISYFPTKVYFDDFQYAACNFPIVLQKKLMLGAKLMSSVNNTEKCCGVRV